MPRHARLDAEGTLHHVIIRGIESARIFGIDRDRRDFIERMGRIALATHTQIYAWALVPSHGHILLRSGPPGLPKFMRRLLTGYAVTYNLRHQRHGHLFQNRYKSIVCEEDPYFRQLVRYIHLNPLRAGIVKDLPELDRHTWSGHAAIMGKAEHPWQNCKYVLSWFGRKERDACRNYRRFVNEGFRQGRRPELVGGGLVRSAGGWSAVVGLRRAGEKRLADERILGSGDFVEKILKEAVPKAKAPFGLYGARKRAAELIGLRCRQEGVAEEEMRMGSRRREVSRMRADLAYRLVRELGLPLAEAARQLGVSTSFISKILQRP